VFAKNAKEDNCLLLPYRLDGTQVLMVEMREEDVLRFKEMFRYIDIKGGLPHRFIVNEYYQEVAYTDPLNKVKKNGEELRGWKRIKTYHDRAR